MHETRCRANPVGQPCMLTEGYLLAKQTGGGRREGQNDGETEKEDEEPKQKVGGVES